VLISVEELKFHPVSISETYPAGALDYHTAEFRQSERLRVRGDAELAGKEIRFRGHLSTRIESTCARCLNSVEMPVECDFDLAYRPMAEIARDEEIQVPAEELGIGFYRGAGIEVADVVTEQVNLFMPMQVVCRPDCRGLCPGCGVNLNLETCKCAVTPSESPFISLLDQIGNRGGSEQKLAAEVRSDLLKDLVSSPARNSEREE
jgi:uncharacterized protein